MSTITAPAPPSYPMYIGKGINGSNGSVTITGHYLPNDGVLGINTIYAPWSISNPTTLFDVSNFNENIEIPVALFSRENISPLIVNDVYTTISWYRVRDDKLVFEFNKNAPIQISDSFYFAAWIGWLSDDLTGVPTYPMYPEIQENGEYYVIFKFSGGYNYTSPKVYFAVTGIPAKLYVSNIGYNGIKWKMRLGNWFDSSNYIRVGVCTNYFTDGTTVEPSQIVSSAYAPAGTNKTTVVSGVVDSLNQNTNYVAVGFAQAANGSYYRMDGATSFRTLGSRPTDWSWQPSIVSGGAFYLTASQWNTFCSKINEFRRYKNLVEIGFTTAPYSDGKFYAFMFNQALTGIRGGELGGYYYPSLPGMNNSYVSRLPSNRSSGDQILASYFNDMRDAINSIT